MSTKKSTTNTANKPTNKVAVAFASLGSYIESRIVENTESKHGVQEYYEWGRDNAFPQYLLSLYKSVASLRSVINGSTDYVVGNSISSEIPLLMGSINSDGDTVSDLIECIAKDYFLYGGYAIEVGRNKMGNVASLRALDFSKLRTDKHNKVIYYSDKWGERWSRAKYTVYQHYNPAHKDIATSVLYVKNTHYQTYPEPLYIASLKACEVERAIDEYHLNAINNNFSASYIVNFNNGVPEEQQMREIQSDFVKKFSGQQNAGRIAFSWNNSADNATTLQKLDIDEFGDRYTALAKHSRQQIYTAFRANPNLFGIPTDSLGFSSEEYAEAFKLYNRTQIRPVQAMLVDSLDYIFGVKGSITIQPFSIEENSEKTVE